MFNKLTGPLPAGLPESLGRADGALLVAWNRLTGPIPKFLCDGNVRDPWHVGLTIGGCHIGSESFEESLFASGDETNRFYCGSCSDRSGTVCGYDTAPCDLGECADEIEREWKSNCNSKNEKQACKKKTTRKKRYYKWNK